MKNNIIIILISLFSSFIVRADEQEQLKEMLILCNSSQSAFDTYRNLVSTPPIIGGEIARTKFADVCDLLSKVYTLNNRVQDLAAKIQLGTTTDSNWKTDLLLGVAITNIGASKYYGESEPTQPADIENQKEDEALKDFYNSIGNDDRVSASKFKDTREQAQQMDGFERAARQKAMLSEALICPDNSGNPDYRKIFEKQIQPMTTERQRFKLKRDHYYQRLLDIGPTFLRDDAYTKYSSQLESIHTSGVIVRTVDDKKAAPYFEKSAPLHDGDEARVIKTNKASVTTQTFYSDTDSGAFEKFKSNWKSRWKDYVDTTHDTLDRALDVTDACFASKPPETDLLNADQVNAYSDYQRRCSKNLDQKAITPSAFMFEEALDRYLVNSERFAALQAQIWTKESALLKKPIVYNTNKNGAVNLDAAPNCEAEPMSESKLKETKIKLLETENEFKEIVAKERIKDGMLRDEELKRQSDFAQKKRVIDSLNNKKKINEKNSIDHMTSPDLGGSF
jgi:hypothetical protein